MDTEVCPGRVRALCTRIVSFLLQPLWGAIFLLTLGFVTLALLEITPGVPSKFRPYTRYKDLRSISFLNEAVQAHERGNLNEARLALSSALALKPNLIPARIQLAHLEVDQNHFAEASRHAASIGMDGTGFVHDMLFYSGRFDELLAYCAQQTIGPDARKSVWLQSALMIAPLAKAETRSKINESLVAANQPESVLLKAILLTSEKRHQEASAKLTEREALPAFGSAETLLGIELIMQAGDPARAWVWLQRHRGLLSDFDSRCSDYRIESVRDPVLARRILQSFPQLPMSDSRWIRLTALVAERGDSDAAILVCQQLATSQPRPSAALSVSAWALLQLYGQDKEASAWERNYQRESVTELPVLAGRNLMNADLKTRSQAVRLLSSSTPLPREMISALLLR